MPARSRKRDRAPSAATTSDAIRVSSLLKTAVAPPGWTEKSLSPAARHSTPLRAVTPGAPVPGYHPGRETTMFRFLLCALLGSLRLLAGVVEHYAAGKRADLTQLGFVDSNGRKCRIGDFKGKATVFQWHGETFSIPPGATRLMHNEWCGSQMFVLGPHLAMQCHVEMTPEMIATWCGSWEEEVAGLVALPLPVQTPQQMQEETAYRLPAMRELAGRLYTSWIHGLKRG